jgi:MoxR-like ATPase
MAGTLKEIVYSQDVLRRYTSPINRRVFAKIIAVMRAAYAAGTVPAILLRGPPGAGKTMITEMLAGITGARYVFRQATLNTAEDELLYNFVPDPSSPSGVSIAPGPLIEALRLSQREPVVLVIDEFDKTRPSADALLLDFVQNVRAAVWLGRELNVVYGNRDNLAVFITSNGYRDFSEPLMRRFAVVDVPMPAPLEVRELFRAEFDERTANLLTLLYAAGLKAGLKKPVTVQELRQFGHALLGGMPFTDAVRTFLVKDNEDFDSYMWALNNVAASDVEALSERLRQQSGDGVPQRLLDEADALAKSRPEPPPIDGEVYMAVPQSQYTAVVLSTLPAPAGDGTDLGRVVGGYLIGTRPLHLFELAALMASGVSGKFYAQALAPVEDVRELVAAVKVIENAKDKFIVMRYASNEIYLTERGGGLAVKFSKDGGLLSVELAVDTEKLSAVKPEEAALFIKELSRRVEAKIKKLVDGVRGNGSEEEIKLVMELAEHLRKFDLLTEEGAGDRFDVYFDVGVRGLPAMRIVRAAAAEGGSGHELRAPP